MKPHPLWTPQKDMRNVKKVDFLDFLLVFCILDLKLVFIAKSFVLCLFFSVRNAYQLFFTTFDKNFFNSHHSILKIFASFS